ncbi:MAG: Gfo/Idh/MocA family oxidoreductase [Clostridia bacterium]|nr:Gfo/Idh/MocA family oxidoreductase [Clostridia bacterium]
MSSKKIRFGIVGTGTIAHRFAQAICNVPEAELVAVASRTKENAEKFGDEFNIPVRFDSYEKMAQSDVIDVAYIAVPHSGHIDCSCLMMNNGKHVLCEKPMAVNLAEAQEMFDCAKQNNVLLMEAMWARLVPGTLEMLEIVRSGVLGDILGVEGKFCYTMDEDEMDHHVFNPENGGGSLLDVGVYGLNFASWYLGKDVEEVNAQSAFYNDVDSHTCVLLKYKNGAIADLSSAILLRKPNEGYVYGTKGYAYLQRFYAPQNIELRLNDGTSRSIPVPYAGNGFEEQIKHFSECVSQGLTQSPVVTPEQTLYITRQMDEIRKMTGIVYPQDKINRKTFKRR